MRNILQERENKEEKNVETKPVIQTKLKLDIWIGDKS
jgi:hypothetical protein